MAKNRSSAFDFGEDLFSKGEAANVAEKLVGIDKVDKIDEIDKIDKIDKTDKKSDASKRKTLDAPTATTVQVNRISKVDKEDKIDKANKPSSIKKEDEIKKVDEIDKIDKVDDAKAGKTDPEKVEVKEMVALSSKLSAEDKAWVKIRSRKMGEQLKQYMNNLIMRAPVCDVPEDVLVKSKGKKDTYCVMVSREAYDSFYQKARESALTNVEYLWYIIDWAKQCETESGNVEK